MATIRERSHGVFEIRVFVGRDGNGRPIQTSRTVHGSRREAERVAASLSLKAPSKAGGRTVADALEAWLEVNIPTWAPQTARDYLSRTKAVANDALGSITLARLSVQDIELWHARLRRQGVGEGGIRNRHIVLRAALTQAETWSWLTFNPARLARLRRPKMQARGVMTPSEVLAVLDAAYELDPRAGLALRLAAAGGLRRAELAALRHTDLRGRELLVDSAVAIIRSGTRQDPGTPELRDDATKTGNVRTVALDEATVELFDEVRESHPDNAYLFGDGDRPANPERIAWWWLRARELAHLESRWRLHDLRHFAASMAIAAGHDVRSVAGRLGHANPAMTLRVYAHAVQGGDTRIADDLGRLLPPPRGRGVTPHGPDEVAPS
jgi:integrase